MVVIVAGSGGLFNVTQNSLGRVGQGNGSLGQATCSGYVNASAGNLILQLLDEQLSGRDLDLFHLRTSNAQGQLNDMDGDGWRWDGELKSTLLSSKEWMEPRLPAAPVIKRTGGSQISQSIPVCCAQTSIGCWAGS